MAASRRSTRPAATVVLPRVVAQPGCRHIDANPRYPAPDLLDESLRQAVAAHGRDLDGDPDAPAGAGHSGPPTTESPSGRHPDLWRVEANRWVLQRVRDPVRAPAGQQARAGARDRAGRDARVRGPSRSRRGDRARMRIHRAARRGGGGPDQPRSPDRPAGFDRRGFHYEVPPQGRGPGAPSSASRATSRRRSGAWSGRPTSAPRAGQPAGPRLPAAHRARRRHLDRRDGHPAPAPPRQALDLAPGSRRGPRERPAWRAIDCTGPGFAGAAPRWTLNLTPTPCSAQRGSMRGQARDGQDCQEEGHCGVAHGGRGRVWIRSVKFR